MLWGEERIANTANALQAQIGQLRRTLGATAIVTSEAGYALDIGPDDLDAARFERLVAKGRRLLEEGETELASSTLSEALQLRRGEPLTEFAYAGFADAERAHLEDLTLVAIEARVEADLVLGHHGELVGELEALCRAHPLRERLWELLMLALYRAGRQAEALRAYTEAHDHLVDELGIDPGPALRQLEARILSQDPSLAAVGPARLQTVAAPTATGNLRERLSSFVGRSAELEELKEVVRSSRLVTLIGPGGVGKTRLRWRRPPSSAKSTEMGPGSSTWPALPKPRALLRRWPALSGRPQPALLAPFRRARPWSSSSVTWPDGRSWSSWTTVST